MKEKKHDFTKMFMGVEKLEPLPDMEPKKLTDEELNKLIVRIEYESWHQNSPELSKAAYMLKYQKAEIERLTEERQTLVDKYNKSDEAVDYWCEKYKQAVKDTAEKYHAMMNEVIEQRDYVEGYAEIGLKEENDEILNEFIKGEK